MLKLINSRRMKFLFLFLFFFTGFAEASTGQSDSRPPALGNTRGATAKARDTLLKPVNVIADSAPRKKWVPSPRQAAIRSAIFPGLGQAYNRRYWKLPLVYGVMAIPGYFFFRNLDLYKKTRFAYKVRVTQDVANYPNIDKELSVLSTESLRYYRDQFRRDIDYSVLFFIIAWGLNVVEATVDAHLQGFDVGTDLSMRIKPVMDPVTRTAGIGLSFSLNSGRR